jgi:hypothetical protein
MLESVQWISLFQFRFVSRGVIKVAGFQFQSNYHNTCWTQFRETTPKPNTGHDIKPLPSYRYNPVSLSSKSISRSRLQLASFDIFRVHILFVSTRATSPVHLHRPNYTKNTRRSHGCLTSFTFTYFISLTLNFARSFLRSW